MALIISYASNGRRAQAELDDWDAERGPEEVAFGFPDAASGGDQVAYFIGGTRQEFVATGRVTAGWRHAGRGSWKGQEYLRVGPPKLVRPSVSAEEMDRLAGFRAPRDACVVPADLTPAVRAVLRHQPFAPEARALEGTRTESTSRYRNPKLRQAALQRAKGVCEGCGTDFSTYAGDLGRRCLVVHHTKQLSDNDEPRWTRTEDLAVVCANCHMIIHADPKKALPIRHLKRILRS